MKRLAFLISATVLYASASLSAQTAGSPAKVQLTIYNQNFALVREEREMGLSKGINLVPVQDVAATIEASSVAFKSLTDPSSVVVREQNYQYDLVNARTILDKSVGKRVTVRHFIDGVDKGFTGTLLSTADNGIVIRDESGLIHLNPAGEIVVGELPQGLVSKPTLVWKLESAKGGAHRTEISYLANNITWLADYVAVVDPLDKYVDLTGWVTLTNNSGATYENASLNLMAGDVHRVQSDRYAKGPRIAYAMEDAGSQFTEKSFFEYHLYTLKESTTVKDRETKQITLLTAARILANKVYIYDGRLNWWNQWRYSSGYRPGESYDVSANKKVNVLIEVVNSARNNLGMPLPRGKVRVYKSEADANQHFIGEDEIDHTPKDEKIRLYLGDAFDIVGEHTRTSFRYISGNEVEESFEISLRNHKDAPVTIVAVEHLTGDWKITQSSRKYFKKDASTVEIPVEVPANGEVKINYTVRTKW